MRVELPPAVLAMADRGPGWAGWVAGLPSLAGDLIEEWDLQVNGAPWHGHTALVLPVWTRGRTPAALKVGFPHAESEHEALALQHWHGRGAVRLLRADPHRSALLLERAHQDTPADLGDLEACEVVAGLYARLHIPAPPQLRLLSDVALGWAQTLRAVPRGAPVPHRLVDQARSLAEAFARDPDSDGVLVHTDLHHANVLAGDREEWLAIDPKPLSGDPHVEPAPMLWNRWTDVVSSGSVREAVRARFHTLVDVAGREEERARDWVVLRASPNAVGTRDAGFLTASVSIAKAVQD